MYDKYTFFSIFAKKQNIMRKKDPNNASKQKILIESFKLFARKAYNDITFSDIEKATGLSRGAILYHFKTKEQIFLEVSEMFLTNKHYKLPDIDIHKSLWENIEIFINMKQKQQAFFTDLGILNASRAFIHIAVNCIIFSKEILENISLRREWEIEYWKTLLSMAIESGEIKKELDIDLYTQLLFNIFYGYSYSCMMTPNGVDINFLLKQYHQFYLTMVNKG